MSGFRLAMGGLVDRGRPISFTFDGRPLTGFAGDTLASALLGAGVDVVARSVLLGRPRGVLGAGPEEPCAFVEVGDEHARELVAATTVELHDGLEARTGRGRIAPAVPLGRERHDRMRAHADVLVVGAGVAGLTAAREAAARGERVMLLEATAHLGGSLAGSGEPVEGIPAEAWVAGLEALLAAAPDARVLRRTTCLGLYDAGEAVALERRLDHLPAAERAAQAGRSRQRLWHIRARRIVVATGALERPIALPDGDRPGVMLAGAVRMYLARFGVAPGRSAVVFTAHDGACATALALRSVGVDVAMVADARPDGPGAEMAGRLAAAGIHVRSGTVVAGTLPDERGCLRGVHLRPLSGPAPDKTVDCDLLAVSGGWDPDVGLVTHVGGRLRWDPAGSAFVPEGLPSWASLAGSAAGGTAEGAAGEMAPAPPTPLWRVPAAPGSADTDADERSFVDLHRDATVADVRRAIGAGLRSMELIKRYTLVGTGPDQGRTANLVAVGVASELLGVPMSDLGTTTVRPPSVPVAFAALAGRDRGRAYDPERHTPIHDRHVAQGAVFEPVGQWLRPRYYPRDGEDMEGAVLRECAGVRERVGMADASTLGKIDIQGPDAGRFLDRVYTNVFSSLRVGQCRYGLVLRLDGMLFDDGVTTRLAADHYHMTTTTGNAAAVLDWLEEWLQTEWPELRVHCTSVTEGWAVVAIAGPRSRDVLAALAPGLDVSAEAFPFMTVREGRVAGLPARVFRISFSGELAYEVNVPWWHGAALWDAVAHAGRPFGITPYGTETMHVLRAEKGYVIVGQETDGSVTPVDLGLERMLSRSKDFLGRRSLRRPDLLRPDRKQLVGLLPLDPDALLVEGSQLVTDASLPPPVPMIGHVTASHRSVALGRTFALALVKGGRSRHGEVVQAVHLGTVTGARITAPVFYDPRDLRRDG